MSLVTNDYVNVFPEQQLREAIERYIKDKGQPPKLLVFSKEDYLDYKVTCTLQQAVQLRDIAPELMVTYGSYLKPGEIDISMGIAEDE